MTQRIASLGECMLELSPRPGGLFALGFGGDTLNTAIYLARCGCAVDYVTALGDDAHSHRLLAAWGAEGVGTALVPRLPGRLPGLYLIETDARGERRFSYWRDRAPARDLFTLPQTPSILEALKGFDWLYFTGVSLSIWGKAGRARLFEFLDSYPGRVAFDTNYRPRGWAGMSEARAAFEGLAGRVHTVFAGSDDERGVFGRVDPAEIEAAWQELGAAEVVVKMGEQGNRVLATDMPVKRLDPVDTTSAGDSFNAAYLAARIAGADPFAACRAGQRIAAAVISHPGAIIPREAMPS